MKKFLKQDILPDVWSILEKRYGKLTLLSGQGVIKGERVEFLMDGALVRCVIKTSTEGRISFGKRDDGKWSGLEESNFVIVVAPATLGRSDFMVSMFDQQSMKNVFNKNQAAQEKAAMGDLPNWIAPFHEEGRGPRGVADGFSDYAIWTEPLSPSSVMAASAPIVPPRKVIRPLTIEEAKQGLAQTYRVGIDSIEISIRW